MGVGITDDDDRRGGDSMAEHQLYLYRRGLYSCPNSKRNLPAQVRLANRRAARRLNPETAGRHCADVDGSTGSHRLVTEQPSIILYTKKKERSVPVRARCTGKPRLGFRLGPATCTTNCPTKPTGLPALCHRPTDRTEPSLSPHEHDTSLRFHRTPLLLLSSAKAEANGPAIQLSRYYVTSNE
jgi:hypothetical protein